MKKLYYLSSCSTCKRILNQWDLPRDFAQQDVKSNPLTLEDLDHMRPCLAEGQSYFKSDNSLKKH